jgi:hypothetical protein
LGAAYRDSLREASAAGQGEVDVGRGQPRAKLLAAQVIGLFLAARIDPVDAA